MDFLFELLLDFIAEGTVALSKNIKVPTYIRYPLIGIIVLFFAAVLGLILVAGFWTLKESILAGSLIIALAVFLLVMGIVKFKKTYLKRKEK